ncbi:TadE/TadG family type IV pilus assembly protein [Nocardiopsis dassonvillei]|uniref:TadE/TadG family type IV pilus assembly protein n=1 Tax=Nocardiopsis dassonvillei TaxID=2014 RepID=UPI0033F56D1F
MNAPLRKRRRRDDRGSASVELILLVPVLIVALVLMVVAGRQVSAALITQDAAAAAARAASLQRGSSAARTQAHQTAERELADRGVVCSPFAAVVDTSGFEPGGTVGVRVACTVTVVDLGGFGGQRTLTATALSPVDPYRGQEP